MPTLIVQKGHCYRHTGATGTAGEQDYATAVANACVSLLDRNGWVVRPTLADENSYRGHAFVAIHCDGSTSPSARGASVGYQTPEGQAFGQAFKRAYAARGWPTFRPDNYTADLHYYYGVSNAVAAGTRRAFIAECGFLTNADDRALLLGAGGPDRVALAIGDALGITTPPTPPLPEEHDMVYILQGGDANLNGTNVYLLSGPMFVGLGGGERADAIDAIKNRNAPFQWVEKPLVDDLDRRSHGLYDAGLLKTMSDQLGKTVTLLQQLVDATESASAKGQP